MTWVYTTYTALSAHHLQAVGLTIHKVALLDKLELVKSLQNDIQCRDGIREPRTLILTTIESRTRLKAPKTTLW